MNKTTKSKVNINERWTVTTPELQGYLGCGRQTAIKIGNNARALIKEGKTVLWHAEKIRKYLDREAA